MGRVILKYNNNRLESLKCKSMERAKEIARKRPNVTSWSFYADNEYVPEQRKKKVEYVPQSFEELDRIMRQQGLIN